MADTAKSDRSRFFVSPEEFVKLRQIVREANAKEGIPLEPLITPEELQARMIANGVRPEDNIGSRELMRMRYGDEWEVGWEDEE